MMTVPISYSSVFDTNAATYYPMLCTNRSYGTICPCTFSNSYNSYNSYSSYNSYNNSYNSSYNSSTCPTPASSPTLTSLFTPTSSPTFGQPLHQTTNLVSAMLNSNSSSLSIGKFSFNPNTILFNQQYPTLLNGMSNQLPFCTNSNQTKRFFFTPGSWKQSYGMETVWLQEFSKLFIQFLPHSWYLLPVEEPPIPEDSLYSFFDSAKVRFSCEQCGHGWTSMKGRVAFWFDLSYNCGLLAFKLYGQTCEKCKNPDRYEQPMWYPEEVSKVLKNVFVKIGQVYYGYLQTTQIERTRRTGKPRTPHNANLCQACKDNVCVYRNKAQ